MKLITAIVTSDDLELTKDALKEAGVTGLTVSEARGFGRRGGQVEMYRGAEHVVDLAPRVRLEMAVADRVAVENVVNVLAKTTRLTGGGAGKVWVSDVEWIVSLRTGEMNADAI